MVTAKPSIKSRSGASIHIKPSVKYTITLTLLSACLSMSSAALAQERKIQRSALPPAVEKSLQAHLEGAKIKGFSTEKEGGKLYYEAALIVDGHTKDIQFDPQGNVTEVEEQVALDTLPAEVQSGLAAKAKQGRIFKVESLTKRGAIVAYEAQVARNGKHSEIQVGPKGETLAHAE